MKAQEDGQQGMAQQTVSGAVPGPMVALARRARLASRTLAQSPVLCAGPGLVGRCCSDS
ncbi:gamma-glutamyl phosphate reductase [Acetobacter malorum]|uniref:Gamma-glutamyl phosphate reductase n=1 Tax=Acetobacter malorum TaxID=178901 RepID=A0A177GCU6_9PROT|nr:gamma-glutamyl phosphate reductase [Acetobacter malorum]